MKAAVLIVLIAINIAALYFGVPRFFVTFADNPVINGCAPVGCGHFHHQGMEDMRVFLLPGLNWLVGLVVFNLCVAVTVLFWRHRPKI
jgi:hypothetical protein